MDIGWNIVLGVVTLCAAIPASAADGETGVGWVSTALAEGMTGFAPFSRSSSECNRTSQQYLDALANSTLWAVQMLDAATLSVDGLLTGDIYSLGHYDQCLEVQEPLRAQYCLGTMKYGPSPGARPSFYRPPASLYKIPLPEQPVWDKVKRTLDPGITPRDEFHWALCVSALCSPEDLQYSLNATLGRVFARHNLRVEISVNPETCSTAEDEMPVSAGYIIVRIVVFMLVTLSILATVYDYMVEYWRENKTWSDKAGAVENMIIAFSLRKNMNELTEKGSNPRLDAINGAKVIAMAAIIFGHRALYTHGLALQNHEDWEMKQFHSLPDAALMNASYLVDIFFTVSGYLTFFGVFKILEKKKQLNFAMAIILRWLRVVPAYLMMMAFVGWLLPNLSEGPLWARRVGLEATRCRDNWWLNLLFVNNYIHDDQQCLLLSWYLACDMQLFIVSLFVIYIFWRWRRIGYVLLATLSAASIAIPFYITYYRQFPGVLRLYASTLLTDPYKNEYFIAMYVKTHNRAGPYIVGIIAGYIATKLMEVEYKFSTKTAFLGWLLLFGGGTVHQFYAYWFYQRDHPYSAVESGLYAALHRVTYSIGIAWCLITFYTSGFGLLRILYAQPIYTPLSRLVYCAVLIHPVVQVAHAASARHSEHMNYPKMFWMACGDYLTAHMFAMPLYLMVEAPFRTLVKMMFRAPSLREENTSAPQEKMSSPKPLEEPKQVTISRL